ncbi:hypothetical protein ACU4GD_00960 [Cupriavidus basilensis]
MTSAKSRSPALWLIGACALAAGVAAIGSCSDDGDDEAVTSAARQLRIAGRLLKADWSAPEDCESVPLDDIYASSLADTAGSSAGGGSGSSGGGHGGGYYGGYHGGTVARWYGPYYTQSGTVYHPDGTQTRRDMSGGAARPMGVYDGSGNLSRVAEATGTPRCDHGGGGHAAPEQPRTRCGRRHLDAIGRRQPRAGILARRLYQPLWRVRPLRWRLRWRTARFSFLPSYTN